MKHLPSLALVTAILAGGTASAAMAETLTFAWSPNPQTPQVDVAIQKGYFEDASTSISFRSVPGARGSRQ